jgi:hypothetical protein
MKLSGAAILVSRGMKGLQAAPAAYPYRSAKEADSVKLRVFLPWVVVVLAATAVLGCDDSKAKWRAEGRAQAESDIAVGKLCVKTYGLPAPWSQKYEALVKEKYGVEFDTVAGCVVSDELVERTAGYNEPMLREIRRQFGPDALEKLTEEARARHEQKIKADRQIEQ